MPRYTDPLFGSSLSRMGSETMYENDALAPTHDKAVSMGTTIMAVRFDGGVILGADSRTSSGSYIVNRVTNKLTPVSDHIYCCRSGSAADTQAISDIVRYELSQHELELGEDAEVATAAALFQNMCYRYKSQLLAGIIVAGWDKHNGGRVFSVPVGGAMIEVDYSIGGSGSGFIYGYCEANYRPNFTREEAKEFVINAASLAMSWDGSSGGVVRTVIIDESGIERDTQMGDHLPYGIMPTKE